MFAVKQIILNLEKRFILIVFRLDLDIRLCVLYICFQLSRATQR